MHPVYSPAFNSMKKTYIIPSCNNVTKNVNYNVNVSDVVNYCNKPIPLEEANETSASRFRNENQFESGITFAQTPLKEQDTFNQFCVVSTEFILN